MQSFNLSPLALPVGTAQTTYTQVFNVTGGTGNVTLTVTNVSGSVPGLPLPGSGVNTLTLTGTPTGSGTVAFTILATDTTGAQNRLQLRLDH